MSPIAQAFGIGMILGIILFFVLAGFGLIDKLIASIDKWFR
jgi:predicted RND superfamily exporter protein